jgi:hypothetical protein
MADNENGAWRMAQHVFSHAAHQQVTQFRMAMRAHHDEIGAVLLRVVDDGVVGITPDHFRSISGWVE